MSEPTSDLKSRKDEHLRINLEEDVQSGLTTGLENYQFIHEALPETDLDTINTEQLLFNKLLTAPIVISSMTGGTLKGTDINRHLATAAQATGIAMGLGSQRVMIEKPEEELSFKVRRYAPDILLFANLGAVQLNYSFTLEHCKYLVDTVGADALFLHLNPLQEALQPEGNTRFEGLEKKITSLCHSLSVPVLIKEVGWGMSGKTAIKLADCGVAGIDVSGAGGTSWSEVERHRIYDPRRKEIATSFKNWGIPTAESIVMVRKAVPHLPVFASGGLKNGIDIAKCIALGANAGGIAGKFLRAAFNGDEEVVNVIHDLNEEIRITMFIVGAKKLSDLNISKLMQPGD